MNENEKNEESLQEEEKIGASTPVEEIIYEPVIAKKKRKPKTCSVWVAVFLILLASLITFQVTFIAVSMDYKLKLNETKAALGDFSAILEMDEIFTENYIYTADRSAIIENMLASYAYASGDRYARYLTGDEYYLEYEQSAGNSAGIGVYVVWNTDSICVTHVMSGGPAESAGVLKGDIITEIDGKSLVGKDIDYAVEQVAGEEGTDVTLTVIRGEEKLTIPVTRGHYTAETVLYDEYERNGKKIGYIRIMQFDLVTENQFKSTVQTLIDGGSEALIFDVRGNPGGYLDVIVSILDYLLPQGPIVTVTDVDGNVVEKYNSDRSEIDMPMAVLADSNTASAAELFTSSLQDYGKAEIIGTQTYGKGCGQTLHRIASTGGYVWITSFLYNPPFSENYDGVGIIPDINVELGEDAKNKNLFLLTLEEDTQLGAALDELSE